MTADEIRELRAEVEAGRMGWDPLGEWWYPTEYRYRDEAGEFRTAYYKPPWPGAPRQLSLWGSLWGDYSRDVQWVVEFGEALGLDLPPALVIGTLAQPFPQGWRYLEEESGFYPALKPGVNVVWAVNGDMTDLSLRPECPVVAKIEVLNTGWAWPNKTFAAAWDIFSYEQYMEDAIAAPHLEFGRSSRWVEEDHRAYIRSTESTPYGWYTFDIETLSMRPVDTAQDSWDTINLWRDDVRHAQGIGRRWYGAVWAPGLDPWPAFDPWREAVPPGLDRSVRPPGVHVSARYYLAPRAEWPGSRPGRPTTRAEYMRITCE